MTDTSEEVKGTTPEEAKAPPSPEELGEHIRNLIIQSRRSRWHRTMQVKKGDLKSLAIWERELTDNYGIKKEGTR